MRLTLDFRLHQKTVEDLAYNLNRLFLDVSNQVNNLSDGRISSYFSANTAAPTTGLFSDGDFVPNSSPGVGKYRGWVWVGDKFIGNDQIGARKDTTANRPTKGTLGLASDLGWAGYLYFDTTLDADGKPIWWTGSAWVDATGAVV